MDKQAVIAHIKTLIKRFNALDKATKADNESTNQFLQDQLKAAELGRIDYGSVWSPMRLYKMKGDDPSMSIREYRLSHGNSTDLVEGFEEIRVAKSDGSGYLVL